MNDNALDLSTGAPPDGLPGEVPGRMLDWRALARVLRSPAQVLSFVAGDLVTTVFPADCRACGDSLLRSRLSSQSLPVCDLCLSRLLPQSQSLSTALCRCCGEALGMESDRFAANTPSEGLLCMPCRIASPPFTKAVAYGVYQDKLREMLHLLKYEGMATLAKQLGGKLAEAILTLETDGFGGVAAVVAVPLFSANQRLRGFNQSILLADEAIARLRKLRVHWQLTARHGLLKRIKATESQFNLSTKGRRRNLIGAFEVQDTRATLAGAEVLLIDDIYTTGATSRACAQALRRAGARRVWVATLARAQKEQVALWASSADDFG